MEGGLAVLSSNSFRSPFLTSCSYNDRRNAIILLMTLPVRSFSLLFVCHIYWFRVWVRCAGIIAAPNLEDTARYQVAAKVVLCPVPESDSDSSSEPEHHHHACGKRTHPRRHSGHPGILQCRQEKNLVDLVTQYNTATWSLIVGEVEKAYQASGVSRREKYLQFSCPMYHHEEPLSRTRNELTNEIDVCVNPIDVYVLLRSRIYITDGTRISCMHFL